MKKLLLLIALCGCMTLLTACGSAESNSTSQQSTIAQQEQTTQAVQTDETKEPESAKFTKPNITS